MRIASRIGKSTLLALSLIVSFSSISTAETVEFSVFQVTDSNPSDKYQNDLLPVINNAGNVMWTSKELNSFNTTVSLRNKENIFQYEPGSTEEGFDIQEEDCINESGALVWAARTNGFTTFNIFMYDGTDIIQLTDDSDNNGGPVINESGQICWYSSKGVYLYDGANTTYLGDGYNPHINDLGQVTWATPSGVMVYDGEQIRKISNEYSIAPRINNNGYVVWHTYAMPPKISLYDGTNIFNIGTGNYPIINENNQVAWRSQESSPSLYYYNNHTAFKLAPLVGSYYGRTYDLNDNGHLAWLENYVYYDQYNRKMFKVIIKLYDGTDISIVTEPVMSGYPGWGGTSINMNNNDEIVWGWREGGDLEISSHPQ